jgi:hypothetical protein
MKIYSYGLEPPKEIKNLLKSNQYKIGNTTKNIQSLMSNLCGYFCLGFIYFLNVSNFRTKVYVYSLSARSWTASSASRRTPAAPSPNVGLTALQVRVLEGA